MCIDAKSGFIYRNYANKAKSDIEKR